MPLIGTAGHVDHGKSTLVQRLTGRDPDRWDEEKERGLTIDLGFAWTTLPSGTEASFVDVPGHGRFIKNMLAGIDGFDVVLLVVAADEGWSVQTTEHVAALDAVGVSQAVVALTKADLADQDMLELAILEIEERLEATALAGAPVVAVSALDGTGIEDLEAALDSALAQSPDPPDGAVDLWVDRVFSVSGAGTVVTGSLTRGSIEVGDQLEVLPSGERVTVRGLHRHDTEVHRVDATGRVAVNLAGVDRAVIDRGSRLRSVTTATATDCLLVALTAAHGEDTPGERGAYHLHLGTGAWRVELRPVDSATALLTADAQLPAVAGDRFVLRDVGRQRVVGGGTVLDPAPPRRRRDNVNRVEHLLGAGTADELATGLLTARGSETDANLRRFSGGGTAGEPVGARRFAPGVLDEVANRLPSLIDGYTNRWPLRPGHPKAELVPATGHALDVVDVLIERAGLVEVGPWVARSGYESAPTADDLASMQHLEQMLGDAGLAPDRLDEMTVDPEVLGYLTRAGTVTRVGPFVYLTTTLDRFTTRLPELGPEWTVAALRDHFEISRKHAVPLVEWLDAENVTRRSGDVRSLRRGEPD